ncbi:hypothetical protein GOP47_0000401 [Adiantum capillus-veneris]|uniref:Uncharacterized protein n=1 Tax=Adiantum capillus-veneris TaxID=13818 RepID=A0A9D4UZE2_ADICA|nr:hypothetical protein GOP47_0009000 [Adiantum capillus-veneris]KAI5084232.1 hypothetical protein GOP47_0000401 [Adiantum capillus-veneris]
MLLGWSKHILNDNPSSHTHAPSIRRDPRRIIHHPINNEDHDHLQMLHEMKYLHADAVRKVLDWRHAQRNPKKCLQLGNVEKSPPLLSPLTIDPRRQRCYPSQDSSMKALEGTSMLQFMKSALHFEDPPKTFTSSSNIVHGHATQYCGQKHPFEEPYMQEVKK